MRARRDRLRRLRDCAGRRRLCRASPAPLADAHFRHLVERFHRLGPGALAEFLAELGGGWLLRSEIELRLAEYVVRPERAPPFKTLSPPRSVSR